MEMKSRNLFALMLAGSFSWTFAANGDAYVWPGYRSDLDYDTKTHIGVVQPPTQFNNNCSGVTGKKAGKWWALYWGADRDSRITDVTIDSILKKYDTDFSYLYDTLGWAPDAQAQDGKYSAIYYYGSGTCAGGSKTDTTGGWQTYIADYTAVAASFYPLYSFNTSCPYRDRVAQMDAMIHEGIHSMTNAYPGAKDAHWFQEAGNTWIQQDMFSHRNAVYSGMGFLNAATVIAPFMPIETYSGWLIDGTFGGPGGGADNGGVTGRNQRSLLGGAQYSNIFPTFLGTWLGTGSVRWIYGNAYGKTKYLLETYALNEGLGIEGTRRLITEFRAKLALLDMKEWSNEIKNLLNQNFGSNTYWEQDYSDNGNYSYTWKMTPYQTVTASGEYLVPNQDITPGWSGANYIPLKVQSGSKQVTVTFYPNGSNSNNTNMNFLICYRATDGTPVYSEPITGEGSVTLRLDKTPSSTNGAQMVFAVVVNTDYQYTNNTDIRTKHFDYKLKLEEGISGAGDAYTKYYNDFKLDYDWNSLPGSSSSGNSSSSSSRPGSSSSAPSSSSSVPSSSSSVPSSSSTTPSSSSSYTPSSSSISSSSEVAETVVLSYDVNITLPIDDNYAGVKFGLNLSQVSSALGLSTADMQQATYFAINHDTQAKNTNSTANAPGHWFDSKGNVVDYGESAMIYSEFQFDKDSAVVGHYPNRVSNGDSYSFQQGFTYNGKTVLYKVTVKITNEIGNGGATTALMYGISGPATHFSLRNKRGILDIQYTLPNKDNVKISLFNAYGALLTYEITPLQNAGTHQHQFDLRNMPQGTYIVKLTTGSYREARSVTISK